MKKIWNIKNILGVVLTASLLLPAGQLDAQQRSNAVTYSNSSRSTAAQSKLLIPGTGHKVAEVGDDFEDESWAYNASLPKVHNSKDDSLSKNYPLGRSLNDRWYEGNKRGQPDSVRRVATPEGGLIDSKGALALRSLKTGSNWPSHQQQQDDFIANVSDRVGFISAQNSPSVVTRVWMPHVDEWENRTGCHFAFRVGLITDRHASFRGISRDADFDGTYWPGMFINLSSKEGKGANNRGYDTAHIWMKATDDGRVMKGPYITQTGWWTLGMSITPDGRVHYFAKPGVEDLTEEDHIGSSYPFGYQARQMRSFFFNVCNGDDGKTWSSEFVIDDPTLYVVRPIAIPAQNASNQRRR